MVSFQPITHDRLVTVIRSHLFLRSVPLEPSQIVDELGLDACSPASFASALEEVAMDPLFCRYAGPPGQVTIEQLIGLSAVRGHRRGPA